MVLECVFFFRNHGSDLAAVTSTSSPTFGGASQRRLAWYLTGPQRLRALPDAQLALTSPISTIPWQVKEIYRLLGRFLLRLLPLVRSCARNPTLPLQASLRAFKPRWHSLTGPTTLRGPRDFGGFLRYMDGHPSSLMTRPLLKTPVFLPRRFKIRPSPPGYLRWQFRSLPNQCSSSPRQRPFGMNGLECTVTDPTLVGRWRLLRDSFMHDRAIVHFRSFMLSSAPSSTNWRSISRTPPISQLNVATARNLPSDSFSWASTPLLACKSAVRFWVMLSFRCWARHSPRHYVSAPPSRLRRLSLPRRQIRLLFFHWHHAHVDVGLTAKDAVRVGVVDVMVSYIRCAFIVSDMDIARIVASKILANPTKWQTPAWRHLRLLLHLSVVQRASLMYLTWLYHRHPPQVSLLLPLL